MAKLLGKFLEIDTTDGLKLFDDDLSNWVALKAPAVVGSDYTLKMPTSVGTAGQLLAVDGSGGLYFTNDNSGINWSTPVDSNIAPDTPNTYEIGGSGNAFLKVWANAIESESAELDVNSPIRVSNNNPLRWRNSANSADIDVLNLNASDVVSFVSPDDLFITSGGGANGIVFEADAEIFLFANANGVNPSQIRIESENGNYAGIRAPVTLGANYVLTLPPNDGSPGQILSTDGSGVLSWANDAGGISWSTPIDSNITMDSPNTYSIGDGTNYGFRLFFTEWRSGTGDLLSAQSDAGFDLYAETDFSAQSYDGTFTLDAASIDLKNNSNASPGTAVELRLYDVDQSNYVGFKAPPIASNYTYTMPASYGTSGNMLGTDGAGVLSWVAGAQWVKYTKTHSQLQSAGTTHDVEVFQLPAKTMIQGVVIKHSTAFAGTGITDYKVSLGITGDLTKYSAQFDVYQAVGAGVGQTTNVMDFESFSSPVSIRMGAESVGAALDQSTAGEVDVWVLLATLP